MSQSDLDQTLLSDFEKILLNSPIMREAYEGLPPVERKSLNDRYLEFVWQMVLTHGQPIIEHSARATGKTFKQFGAFILTCKAGKRVQYHGPDWVAVDRITWKEIQARLAKAEIKITVDEFKPEGEL